MPDRNQEAPDPVPVPDGEVRDELPADLDPNLTAAEYRIPDNARRRMAAVVLLVVAAAAALVWMLAGDDAVLVNDGFLWAAAGLTAFAGYTLLASQPVGVDEREALVIATREVGFPVGHAAASLGWRGLRSRPTWRILLFSAEEPPQRQALVLVDAADGAVLGHVAEDTPAVSGS